MIFVPVDGEVYGETIRGKFDFCLKKLSDLSKIFFQFPLLGSKSICTPLT